MLFGSISDGTSNTFAFGEISWNDITHRAWHRGFYASSFDATNADAVTAGYHMSVKCAMAHHTINIGVKRRAVNDWTGTSDQTTGVVRFGVLKNVGAWGSEHPGGCHFSLADGSVRFVSENLSGTVLCALMGINDGESYQIP